MNYTFRLKEPNSENETLIYFRSYFGNEKRELIYSTGEKIQPSEWDFDNYQPNNLRGRGKIGNNHRTINKQLNRYSDLLQEIVNQYKNIEEELTIIKVRIRVNEEYIKTKSKDESIRIN